MKIFNQIFERKTKSQINSYQDFWEWFVKHQSEFHKVVKEEKNIEKLFFNKACPKLDALREGFYLLTGMLDDDTVELVITADGDIKNIVFVEELVQAAPQLPNWKFTALKPELDIENCSIHMGDYVFDSSNLSFVVNEAAQFPDDIDITIIYDDFNAEGESLILNGVDIFLDNFLGELNFATKVDYLNVVGKGELHQTLIPIEKLKDFLNWREKEFVEKYEATRYDSDKDEYTVFEAELKSGMLLLASMNSTLLNWACKASHQWILTVNLNYKITSSHGLPEPETNHLLNKIEDDLIEALKASDSNLFVGHETANGKREIYFACKEFRRSIKTVDQYAQSFKNARIEFSYDIEKDKYWHSFKRFMGN